MWAYCSRKVKPLLILVYVMKLPDPTRLMSRPRFRDNVPVTCAHDRNTILSLTYLYRPSLILYPY